MDDTHAAEDRERTVHVTILGQEYPIRADVDATYVREIAATLDTRMRKVHQSEPSRPPLKIAVLTALNLMDEVCTLRREKEELQRSYERRVREFEESLTRGLSE